MGFIDMFIARCRTFRRRDILAIVFFAALLLAVAFSEVFSNNFGFRNNFGFQSGWDCSHLPETEPVCVKKPSPGGAPM
jgi:hypothetical protein